MREGVEEQEIYAQIDTKTHWGNEKCVRRENFVVGIKCVVCNKDNLRGRGGGEREGGR